MKTLYAKVKFTNEIVKNKYNDKTYDYITFFNDLKEGDLIVVGTKFGYSVAEFVCYKDEKGNSNSFIVDKVDTSVYESLRERQYKIKKLSKEIDERAKQALQRKKLDELATSDQELKTMLDTLDALVSAD
ncbi:hypothetical protein FWK73_11400 [Listeria monocytogenes]|uniref:Uncharacterized protein n=1 Tax=Listeria farberi TaxID=2713500 RepID=A0ABR6SQJ8_9LIST|nr:hypothetical protein [Listeria farberi]EAF2286810.1 hypothetical protein [Listeria monocytogenes]EDN9304962.1 hypothetical protein [Listeria monocytogenes]MBC1376554.1 hypothetical protein [Listeria farberi]